MSTPRWLEFHHLRDERGALTAIEAEKHVPFATRRVFYLHGVDSRATRGGHANAVSEQVLTALSGALTVELSDGLTTRTFVLDDPTRGVYMPPLHWIRMSGFRPGTVCLVLASTRFDPAEYIRSWPEFIARRGLVARRAAPPPAADLPR
jgi:hypothetical protein